MNKQSGLLSIAWILFWLQIIVYTISLIAAVILGLGIYTSFFMTFIPLFLLPVVEINALTLIAWKAGAFILSSVTVLLFSAIQKNLPSKNNSLGFVLSLVVFLVVLCSIALTFLGGGI